MTSPILIGE